MHTHILLHCTMSMSHVRAHAAYGVRWEFLFLWPLAREVITANGSYKLRPRRRAKLQNMGGAPKRCITHFGGFRDKIDNISLSLGV